MRGATLCLLAALAAACAPATTGRDFDLSDVEKIRVGVTTTDDLRRMFGEPTGRLVGERAAETWVFSFARGDVETKTLSVRLHRDVVTDCRLTVRAGGAQGAARAPAEAMPCGE